VYEDEEKGRWEGNHRDLSLRGEKGEVGLWPMGWGGRLGLLPLHTK